VVQNPPLFINYLKYDSIGAERSPIYLLSMFVLSVTPNEIGCRRRCWTVGDDEQSVNAVYFPHVTRKCNLFNISASKTLLRLSSRVDDYLPFCVHIIFLLSLHNIVLLISIICIYKRCTRSMRIITFFIKIKNENGKNLENL